MHGRAVSESAEVQENLPTDGEHLLCPPPPLSGRLLLTIVAGQHHFVCTQESVLSWPGK